MNAFYEHHQDSIRFGYRCFDRILLNGLIQPFQQPERVVGFFDTYLPFSARVYLNQHHWLANRMREEGIDFQQCSNAFLRCGTPERLQELADSRAPISGPICARGHCLGSWRREQPPEAGGMLTTEPSPSCPWCGKPFAPRRSGGSRQTFCGADCRHRFHRAARQWAESAVAAGILTIADLRSGPGEACTLAGEGKAPAPVAEEGKAIGLLDDLLHELLIDTFPDTVLDALSAEVLGRIADYLSE
jgi:hypothetical protein